MSEGKPTKAKWWSRPRPQGAGPDTTTDHLTEPVPSEAAGTAVPEGGAGAPGARTPGAAADARTQPGAADARVSRDEGRPAADEGDYELGRPGPSVALTGAAGADGDGDFELGRPGRSEAPAAADGDGDFALERPASAPRGSAPGGESSEHVAAPAERPKPLHDPDPYGTPPYGQPGPWAPAPPVQHPAATPAHGTQVPPVQHPGATPAHGTQVPPVQHPGATPAHGTPAPPVQHPGATPAHGTQVPPVQHPGATPAHGTQVPPVQHPGATPAQGTYVPAGTAAQGTPFDASAQAAPFDAASQAAPFDAASQAAPLPSPPVGHGAPVPPAPYAGAAHEPPVQSPQPPSPWQNYDPWAPRPLQQNGAAVASVTQRRKRAKKVLVGGAVVLALVSGGVGGAVGAYLERNGGVGDVELPQAGKEAPGRAPESVAGIAARALPSVVTLHVRGSQEEGTGTGFVLDSQGHILTNNHVVEPAGGSGEISVTFSGGETAEAEVVGHDSGYDLAVVKVTDVSGLDPLPLGNSDNVQVGDPVVAIGAPFDLANTVTSGIISAKERPITAGGESGDGSDVSYVDALQTDAPINPGNSGGPLLDSKARVIGINSAIRSADSGSDLKGGQAGSIGLGFAIPINQGKRVAEELINTGKATHPVIGVTLDMDYSGDGARVGTKGNGGGPPVIAGGPGAEAGIKAGDIITEVDGRPVHSGEELIVKTRAHRPGDRLQLTLQRGGKEKTVTLVLGSADGG
ncbi:MULTISPECIES: S1C family serine protease [Streptomyces]|uniref:S1C family serine protease n=1 Tax=Streptomyces TaxID=1883 RepID=UPI000C5A91A9|nr:MULTISPECIES: trypsin-like peptidase domain-containing protein [Streptomyces]PIB10297.1 protease [Streptomyces sp. HG99]